MPTTPFAPVLHHIRALAGAGEVTLTDQQLLNRYTSRNDGTAFAILVRRHGPMVFGVCRRFLNDRHDAEDAFQATFLVLVRRARKLRQPELLGNWLFGVARRVAQKAKARADRRRDRRGRAAEVPGGLCLRQPMHTAQHQGCPIFLGQAGDRVV